ncbi:MAG: CPBP family intramembrane glutamic endopeptidase [Candidatus Saccharibacteria bacterium]
MSDVTAGPTHSSIKSSPITWGPIAAVLVTLIAYFASQLFGSVIILGFAKTQGWSHEQIVAWTDKVWPQFVYILIVEAAMLGILWFYLKHRKASFKTLGLVKQIGWKDLTYTLIGFAIYLPLLIAAMAAVKVWFPGVNLEQQQQIGFQAAHGYSLIVVFVSLVVLPPVAEEIVARGFLYLGLKSKLPVIWAAIFTSLIFASAHLQFGSNAPLLWAAAIDTFILSMVLVFLREKTGHLWSSIGLHMIKNSLAFMALFIFVT